ncbi:hypothetical protein FSW04_13835 [Baekduia soli]|uniref:Uncharacterized protein n=1 Tax=Baekduia soli TaxID=496014 RepID=A0A5B8U5Y8_9ACTN|nr:hypothetical protein [Baekduia soli]QEC48539.1 hypothetical protein FSW04_13835 [Baekduia soli]
MHNSFRIVDHLHGFRLAPDAEGGAGSPRPEWLVRVVTTEGVMDLELPDAEQRSVAGSHWNAVTAYLRGDTNALAPYARQQVAGFELETDPDLIDIREAEGELDVETIYPKGDL